MFTPCLLFLVLLAILADGNLENFPIRMKFTKAEDFSYAVLIGELVFSRTSLDLAWIVASTVVVHSWRFVHYF